MNYRFSIFLLFIVAIIFSGCAKSIENLDHHMNVQDQRMETSADSLRNAYMSIYNKKPDSPEAAFLYARTLKNSQAMDILNNLLSKNSDFEQALVLKAKLQIDKGDFDNALESLRKALMLNEMDWRAHYYKAVAHDSLNQFLEAENSFSNAIMNVHQDDDFHANIVTNSTKRMKARKLVVIQENQRKLNEKKEKVEKMIMERNKLHNPVGIWKGMSKLGTIRLVIQNDY